MRASCLIRGTLHQITATCMMDASNLVVHLGVLSRSFGDRSTLRTSHAELELGTIRGRLLALVEQLERVSVGADKEAFHGMLPLALCWFVVLTSADDWGLTGA